MVSRRQALLGFGAALIAGGLLLLYIPVPGQGVSSKVVPVGFGESITVAGNYAVLTTSVPFHVSWSSPSPVHVNIFGCGTDPTCNATITAQPTPTPIVSGSGSSGTLTFNGQKGHSYLVVPNGSANATSVAVDYALPWQGGAPGLGFIAGGLVLLVVGILAGRRPRPSPESAEPA
ncbi:MAG: hypothetical protein L3K15_05295 [Thermoplasmata archaeon]|nr:hypothetical protein [Thermoplasmata archaeon]